MSRKIKFRAWDTIDQKYLEPDCGSKDFPILIAIGLHGLPIAIDKDSFESEEIIGWNRDHNVILEQYTGLKDKNGVKIYEGDIVKIKNKLNGRHGEYNTEIIYDKGMFKLKENKTIFKDGYFWLSEVIGNTHENEDLLK